MKRVEEVKIASVGREFTRGRRQFTSLTCTFHTIAHLEFTSATCLLLLCLSFFLPDPRENLPKRGSGSECVWE